MRVSEAYVLAQLHGGMGEVSLRARAEGEQDEEEKKEDDGDGRRVDDEVLSSVLEELGQRAEGSAAARVFARRRSSSPSPASGSPPDVSDSEGDCEDRSSVGSDSSRPSSDRRGYKKQQRMSAGSA
jgi:hypothetical protein